MRVSFFLSVLVKQELWEFYMALYQNLDEQLADLDIAEEENEEFTFEGDME